MFEKAFVHHELDWRYLSLEVALERLEDAVRGLRALGLRGGNCVGPHKAAVGRLLDRLGRAAELTGVVNCIRREDDQLIGENTEGLAFLESLRLRVDPAGQRVVVFGAGQMGRAVAVELASAGVGELFVVNRHEERAQQLVELVRGTFPTPVSTLAWEDRVALPPDVRVLVNATALGGDDSEESIPVDVESLPADLIVADVTTNPPETGLIRESEDRGLVTIDGLEIFIAQAALDFKMWTGVDPDRNVIREAVEEFLEL